MRHDYAELGRRIGCLAVGLLSPGARTGDTVAVMDWDTHRYIECFFAIPMAGLEMHTINIRLSAEQLAYTINQARDDTTGTTGLPKAVHFSHRQLVLQTLACRSALGGPGEGRFNHDDVYMPVTPMFHVHAWGLRCVATLMGVKQVYPGRYLPDRLLNLFDREKVTFSHCVPTIQQMMRNAAAARDLRLEGRTVVIGGAALLRSLASAALARGMDIFAGDGMSEVARCR